MQSDLATPKLVRSAERQSLRWYDAIVVLTSVHISRTSILATPALVIGEESSAMECCRS